MEGPDQRKEKTGLLQKRLEQEWHREMGLPLRILLLVLVLITYCGSMAAIGAHNLAGKLRRRS